MCPESKDRIVEPSCETLTPVKNTNAGLLIVMLHADTSTRNKNAGAPDSTNLYGAGISDVTATKGVVADGRACVSSYALSPDDVMIP